MGKTTLLRYPHDPARRAELFGNLAARLFMQYIDAQTFGMAFNQSQFWQTALQPLGKRCPRPKPTPATVRKPRSCSVAGR